MAQEEYAHTGPQLLAASSDGGGTLTEVRSRSKAEILFPHMVRPSPAVLVAASLQSSAAILPPTWKNYFTSLVLFAQRVGRYRAAWGARSNTRLGMDNRRRLRIITTIRKESV